MKTSPVGLVATLVIGIALGAGAAKWWAETATPGPAVAIPVREAKSDLPTVEVAAVQQVQIPRGVSAVGSLRSEDAVILRPEVSGRIVEINFDEGGRVKRGDILFRLDDSVVKAQLQQAQANLNLASSQYRRAEQLTKQGFISKQARDESASQLRVQQAAVALAQAQLDKTVIRAPFDGMVGLRNVSVGDYVGPGTDLVPIESVDPLKVDFRIPEQFLPDVHVGLALTLSFDALPGQTREGEVGAISPLVDVTGRSILLRAEVPNSDGSLRPGMFARVRLQFSNAHALTVPETALAPSGEEQTVFVLREGRTHRTIVQTGVRRDGFVEIVSGLAAGDQVVTAGLQKIRDGGAVRVLTPSEPAT